MDIIYPVLISEMARKGVKRADISERINISGRALYNKLIGKTAFLWPEVIAIQETFFPDADKETLFSTSPEIQESKQNGVLSDKYAELTVFDQETGKKYAVITNDLITTARDSIVVKLQPKCG